MSATGGSSHADTIPAGIYRGVVEGIESGHCTARIQVQVAPGGCRIVDYEAVSDEHGLQHIEHALLTPDTLYVAFAEAPGVTTFRATADGVYESAGEPRMQIHVSWSDEVLTWTWHWGTDSEPVIERSRAVCRRTDC